MPNLATLSAFVTAGLLTLASAGCASGSGSPGAEGEPGTLQGRIVSIDTDPWMYDGSAVIRIATDTGREVPVELPARWNLCAAPPVDVAALAPGQQVEVVGRVGHAGAVVVCDDATHRLRPLDR
ncbi:hypothetical protein [Luteimonas deserti]|uniref:DUF5666 domain-containing protein n=1 Tax=Luteimonas deserti TaxID=2752306 RepID=A0A7Z0TWE7_9GAMM|nr:hypothetical protein [Luteimonas deserti]NYZ63259.1 hypothetical protein [Luteimonas deserti]